jgi:enoyl-[acyl-carrier-protein] reductase (NADH)
VGLVGGDLVAIAIAESGRGAQEEADHFVRPARPSSIIQRAPEVDEVANRVACPASALSCATTGAALRVDGGVVNSMAI